MGKQVLIFERVETRAEGMMKEAMTGKSGKTGLRRVRIKSERY